jgi:hypothetical protein
MKNINTMSANEVNAEVEKLLTGKRSSYKMEELLKRATQIAHTPSKKSISTTKHQKKIVTY